MTHHELDFFAFDDPVKPEVGSLNGLQRPPEYVARMLKAGDLPELPERRPYSLGADMQIVKRRYPSLGNLLAKGEPVPKMHSNGTIRVYSSYYEGCDCTAFVVDRDDRTYSQFDATSDCIMMSDRSISEIGNDDYSAGLALLVRLASETVPSEAPGRRGDTWGHIWPIFDAAYRPDER